MPPRPLALPPALPAELLTYILQHTRSNSTSQTPNFRTTLVVCQSRSTFQTSLLQPSQIQSHLSPQRDEECVTSPQLESSKPPDLDELPPLLVDTLHQVATSRAVKVVFMPSVSHLRAWLAVFHAQDKGKQGVDGGRHMPETQVPMLIVYGLLELHRDTSEWSAQGISDTISGVVEAGWRSESKVVLTEQRGTDRYWKRCEDEDNGAEIEIGDVPDIWEASVPMLNGSARRAGLDGEEGAWSGRTIEVRRILARWFKFGRGLQELDA